MGRFREGVDARLALTRLIGLCLVCFLNRFTLSKAVGIDFGKPSNLLNSKLGKLPHIPEIASEFDAESFAAVVERARANSVTVFAKCHHGMCYYPTKTGTPHPGLQEGRDLLGEQIEALHRRGIRAPIYTTVVWEEDVAQKHPEWRQMTRDGRFAGWAVGPDGQAGHVGTWKFNNFLNPDYQDYIEEHVRELVSRYGDEVDGFFFDILFFAPEACWSDDSLAFREKHDLMAEDIDTYARIQGVAQRAFVERFRSLVHNLVPQATIFYNAHNDGNMPPEAGPRARAEWQTHNEIESLPSGFWGYIHFPRMARAQSTWNKPWLGMTGRFQKMWGDFGGIKPQAALEFECFRAQALGGGNSVGDQLPPRGTLDPAAYELIGSVFSQVEQAEPFYANAEFLSPRIGIFSASHLGLDGGKSEEGVVQMCEESHYDCAVLDGQSDLGGFETLILPDSTVVEAELAAKLKEFHAAGGNLLVSHRSGFDAQGQWMLDFLPIHFCGEVTKFPTYWRARPKFDKTMSVSDRVCYSQGMQVEPGAGVEVLVDRVLPYFKRTDLTFSSHFQTPPVAGVDQYPAVVAGKHFAYFADPIFQEYRQSGNLTCRDVFRRCLRDLAGLPLAGDGLPSTVLVYPLKRKSDLLLTLLHYIPVRKALDIDIIEERSAFSGEVLRLHGASDETVVRDFVSGRTLDRDENGAFLLPAAKGRLLLEVPGWFDRK